GAGHTHDCYGPARAKLFMNRPQLDDTQMHDVSWIGSSYFVDTSGFYDTYHAKTPRDGWAYESNRDAGLAQVPSGAGYPTCRQWWNDSSNGLRARLLSQVDPSLLNRVAGWAGFLSRQEVDDSVIRAIASPRQQKLNQGSVYTDYGGQIDKTLPNVVNRATSDVGLAVGSLAAFPAMDVVRQALPMVLSLLKMALVICIPLVLVVGTYDLKTLVTVSIVQFALFFVDFWFQLARWIDSTILDALYGWGFGYNRPHANFDPLAGLNNAFGDLLLMFVMGTMFIVLPTFWIMALSWAGVRAGNVLQGLAGATGDAKAAGGKGASTVLGAISKK
ncbi:conjugal transfer protein TraG N-terminal domain-containing protein, partial [Xanthomonas hortorum]|uniref:conjugal transfer protein TraG N-terminal domain-containing protein n=1 Tax=Xanthomonas hortorum TaxID=56454 RepID=UPI000D50C22A